MVRTGSTTADAEVGSGGSGGSEAAHYTVQVNRLQAVPGPLCWSGPPGKCPHNIQNFPISTVFRERQGNEFTIQAVCERF